MSRPVCIERNSCNLRDIDSVTNEFVPTNTTESDIVIELPRNVCLLGVESTYRFKVSRNRNVVYSNSALLKKRTSYTVEPMPTENELRGARFNYGQKAASAAAVSTTDATIYAPFMPAALEPRASVVRYAPINAYAHNNVAIASQDHTLNNKDSAGKYVKASYMIAATLVPPVSGPTTKNVVHTIPEDSIVDAIRLIPTQVLDSNTQLNKVYDAFKYNGPNVNAKVQLSELSAFVADSGANDFYDRVVKYRIDDHVFSLYIFYDDVTNHDLTSKLPIIIKNAPETNRSIGAGDVIGIIEIGVAIVKALLDISREVKLMDLDTNMFEVARLIGEHGEDAESYIASAWPSLIGISDRISAKLPTISMRSVRNSVVKIPSCLAEYNLMVLSGMYKIDV